MRLWRLSGVRFARASDGGYGLVAEGRWNSIGRPVTYCSSSPALCLLEKLVHVEDPTLLPDLELVAYDLPDETVVDEVRPETLPTDWQRRESLTQGMGDGWLEARTAPLLRVPSVIVPIADGPDRNYLINHRHPEVARITIARSEPFTLDPRLVRL